MGMDGLSMAGTGALKEATSADYANKTEQTMQSDPTNDTKQVQNVSTNRRVREKENDEENGKNKQGQGGEPSQKQDEIEDSFIATANENDKEEFDIEELDSPNKDFYVKLNAKDDIIELYDSSNDRLIETISGNELQELVKRLNMASGIFVNKKV